MKRQKLLVGVAATVVLLLGLAAGLATAQAPETGGAGSSAVPLSTAFTYQGRLSQDGTPANGNCDIRFILYDAAIGGNLVGLIADRTGVSVTDGMFTVPDLDFGSGAFTGAKRWLDVAVRCPTGSGSYTTIGDRQELTATPYALYATGAPWSGLTGVPAGFADGIDNDGVGGLACSNGQVPKWNGAAWACAMDWSLAGNAGTTLGTDFLGTTDNQALELKVNGARALRIEPNAVSPNLIGGYSGNTVSAGHGGGTIGGGGQAGSTCGSGSDPCGNQVTGDGGTIGGGEANSVAGAAGTVAGGERNSASGAYAAVPGGNNNTAGGAYSFAAGRRAKANNQGSFVWGDSTDADITSAASNQFLARASGGVYFYTNSDLTSGAYMGAGDGAWNTVTDRNLKENFADVDSRALLDRLARVPVTTWNYKSQDAAIRHIGPVAQDFYAAFSVGQDDTHISTLDADGVALAAIQGLYQVVQEQGTQLAALQAENAALKAAVASQGQVNSDLDVRVAALEARAGGAGSVAGRWGMLGLAAAGLAVGAVLTRRGGGR